MNIATPPGYKALVALDKEKHRGQGITRRSHHVFAASLNSIYLVAAEFVQAARHYPIVFAQDSDTGNFSPLAVTSLMQEQNLFIGDDGQWQKDTYIPAFVRRWPFFGVPLTGEEAKNGNILICVDESGLEPSDQPVFDAEGNPSEEFAAAQTLISEIEGARQATEHLCQSVRELGLLEPFEAHAFPKQGKEMRLRGMFRVNETKLNELQTRDIKRLMKHGELSRIYAHLMSLDNFKFLMDRSADIRKNARLVS
ncbi:MAG TPA: SapC family protein [Gammaproteobacteria bacterium]|nr:SapC family protein [Gammaproteobacteria bacterium]